MTVIMPHVVQLIVMAILVTIFYKLCRFGGIDVSRFDIKERMMKKQWKAIVQ